VHLALGLRALDEHARVRVSPANAHITWASSATTLRNVPGSCSFAIVSFSTPTTIRSRDWTATTVVPRWTAACACSIWNRRPSGLKRVIERPYPDIS
jgi:hypothetical protein